MNMPKLFPGSDNDSSEVHLGRVLQIFREFSTDPILIIYVIDDVWDYMKAMKVCYYLLAFISFLFNAVELFNLTFGS